MKKGIWFFIGLAVIALLIQYWWVLLIVAGVAIIIFAVAKFNTSKNNDANTQEDSRTDMYNHPSSTVEDKSSHDESDQDWDVNTKDTESLTQVDDLHSSQFNQYRHARTTDEPTHLKIDTSQTTSIKKRKYIEPTVTKPIPKIHRLRRKLTDFVVFDIETTGLSRFDDAIIQISALKYRNDQFVDKFNSFINPHRHLEQKIIYLTGITDKDLVDAPEANDVITKFTTFAQGLPLVGHNIIKFDIPFMIAQGFYLPDIDALDTLPLSQSKLPSLNDHKLPTLKKYFGIVNRSHNALNDCETNAIVYLNLRDDKLDQVKPDYSSIPKSIAGIRFCITGEFIEESRDDLVEEIKQHGGRYTRAVSGLTNYLIKGTQTSSNLVDGVHSNSELKVIENAKKGKITKVIGLSEFHALINTENIEV